LIERLKPGWQSMVEGWSDSQKLMREASDQTMMSLVKGGEDAFVKFATTGKLSIKDLSQTMIADLARVEYRKLIGGEAAKPGGGAVAGLAALLGAGKKEEGADFVGPREQGAPVKVMKESVDALTPVLNKFKDGLAGSTGELGNFIGGLGSSLSGLFSGSGGSGGGGLGSLFTSIMSLFAADGASFGAGGVRAFADGGQFTNKIVDRDTRFRYREGGREKLGLMGEAGPEAIMPLSGGGAQAIGSDGRKLGNLPVTRAADGRLSVVVSGAAPSVAAAQSPRSARFANGGTFGVAPQALQSVAGRQSTQLQISAPVNVTISDNAQVQNMINQALSAQHRALSARLKQQLGVTV
jgi:phage-related minor tail protein